MTFKEQAGAELGQTQLKLELGFTSIKICCIKLITYLHLLIYTTSRNQSLTTFPINLAAI